MRSGQETGLPGGGCSLFDRHHVPLRWSGRTGLYHQVSQARGKRGTDGNPLLFNHHSNTDPS